MTGMPLKGSGEGQAEAGTLQSKAGEAGQEEKTAEEERRC